MKRHLSPGGLSCGCSPVTIERVLTLDGHRQPTQYPPRRPALPHLPRYFSRRMCSISTAFLHILHPTSFLVHFHCPQLSCIASTLLSYQRTHKVSIPFQYTTNRLPTSYLTTCWCTAPS
ncbi:hypothetical protein K491DRAFT_179900 [Lophiostoma macrostomum CBS 122681]|uniref:Uncharacterized protein n=1 Tax=Lophiostoma macrostomum CBS 122681 TaxID=1314788 RepID=A0A6A6TV33_9PLEO|nr:hypothetical protein K491DRAFT_179900 [Lophiostoma macrostomum CBS 122681]